MSAILRKYGAATHIRVPMVKYGATDFAVGADWTPAAGDVKVSKDGGAAANIATLPSAIAMGNVAYWDFPLSATEMQAASVVVTVGDSSTKVVEDQFFEIETYGNAAAEIGTSLGRATFSATLASGGANTAVFPSGTTAAQVPIGSIIRVLAGAGAGQAGKVATFTGGGGSTPTATMVQNWPLANTSNTSFVDVEPDDGIVPADASTLATASALTAVAGKIASIDSRIPAALSANGYMLVDVRYVCADLQQRNSTVQSNYGPVA